MLVCVQRCGAEWKVTRSESVPRSAAQPPQTKRASAGDLPFWNVRCNGPEVDVVGVASYEGAVPTPLANAFRCLSAHAHSRLSQLLARAAYSVIMASPNLRIMGFGNPLLDISAVVEQETLDKCVSHSTPCPLS